MWNSDKVFSSVYHVEILNKLLANIISYTHYLQCISGGGGVCVWGWGIIAVKHDVLFFDAVRLYTGSAHIWKKKPCI